MKHFLKTFLLIALCAIGASAQSTFYFGGGPSIHSDLPRGAMNVTFAICNADATTCPFVNYSARGTVNDFKQATLTYSSSAGVRQVIARTSANGNVVDLFLLGNGGASIAETATGFSGAAGGGLTFHPAKTPHVGVTFAAQGEYSPVNPGWRPNLFVQFGYLFGGK